VGAKGEDNGRRMLIRGDLTEEEWQQKNWERRFGLKQGECIGKTISGREQSRMGGKKELGVRKRR